MITLQRGKIALQRLEASDNDQIQEWINAVTAIVEQYCNQPIVSATKVVEKYYSNEQVFGYAPSRDYTNPFGSMTSDETASGARLLIPLPFVAVPVTLVTAKYKSTVFDSWTTTTDTTGVITVNNAYHLGRQNGFAGYFWQLTFTAGYDVTLNSESHITASDVPSDLQQVAIEMLQIMQRDDRAGKDTLGLLNMTASAGGSNVSIGLKDMSPRWNDMLDNYRVRAVA